MKILSLTQPWATLLVIGPPNGKGIETRSWSTAYVGKVAIHATKDAASVEVARTPEFYKTISRAGYLHAFDLPRAAIVGWVEVTDCLEMTDFGGCPNHLGGLCIKCDPRLTPNERAFGAYAPGRFAWITGKRKMLKHPIPYKGALGLRNLPDAVAEMVLGGE